MKFTIATEHRDFFQKQRLIEFEGLLTEQQISQLGEGIDAALIERLNSSKEEINRISPGRLFMAGHDLWRSNLLVEKFVKQKQLAEIASELIEQRGFRLGYDQLFPEIRGRIYQSTVSDAYHTLIEKQASLVSTSSFDGVLCGLMICLSGDSSNANPGSVFAKRAGNCVFFHPEVTIDFTELQQHPMQRHFLIVYVRSNSNYIRNDSDPHTHALKKIDYSFGEKLKEKWHPTVNR